MRVLIVGVGSIGERHLRAFQAVGMTDLAIADVDSRLRAMVAARYRIGDAFATLDDAMSWRPDAAVIATPAHTHIELANRLADNGIHLLIEKPLSTTLNGVDRLSETARNKRLVVSVGYVYRFHPCLSAMRGAVVAGKFGTPVQLVAVAGQHFPTFRPAYREIYYADLSTGGGATQDALTHLIDAGQWLVGPIDRLVADAAHLVLDGVAVDDTVQVLARHGRVLACYNLNQHQAPNELTITLHGDRGTARWEFHSHRWSWMTSPGGPWHEEASAAMERDWMFVAQARAFLNAIERATPSDCTLEEAVQTQRVILACRESVATQTWRQVARDTAS
jgi:predicted dehydrogenase